MEFPASPLTLIDDVFAQKKLAKARRLVALITMANELKSSDVANPLELVFNAFLLDWM
jgi:hypothetical protein